MIANDIQTRLDSYVELYDKIRQRVDDAQIVHLILSELAKDARSLERQQQDSGSYGNHGRSEERAATENQIRLLQKLGVDIPPQLSREEASMLIDEAKARSHAAPPLIRMPRRLP
jgi:hypothetical protein